MDQFVKKPNQVAAWQSFFARPEVRDLPIFLRGKNDLAIYRGAMGAVAVTVSVVLIGLTQMSLNKGRKSS
ncbi:hypothetical protein CAOG_06740 [Capsaspora owczarzaki ATCC 30864]|uniref:Uncharacterized protein n=1 Tax=Capsaspora owczarzaki (strain ATCC 30864) TaxID=595528 RepID=A0A0D2VXL4_CAPO3|nr:hypothetical protein CAOG_06740 [Capsaspora owczarzaki ATCC 30864]KJE96407.1 hypothetical protein CAOG_006740 [Capsaspora owczarzaki ATCC 30864]|eukprot:XP_004344361.1 hypothetical protein CAOG_06740 [Capsaspora owczarzaki ATCC 30864]